MISRRRFIRNTSIAGVGIFIRCGINPDFDIIIKNGLIIDGSGQPGYHSDVGIKGEFIKSTGNLSDATANSIIDAKGKIISPGFVDIHSHTDVQLFVNPLAESKIHQGITTEISGNCGYSAFPLSGKDISEYHNEIKEVFNTDTYWENIDDFFKALEINGHAVNYATFSGHGNLRTKTVGKNDVAPNSQQMQEMKDILARNMESGSLGLSSGLEYAPGSYADTNELIELCKVVSEYSGVYSTHMRDEENLVIEALDEAIKIGKTANVPVQISHLKAANPANWNKVDELLEMITSSIKSGLPISADRYPYTAFSTSLSIFLPLWSRQGETDEILDRLKDKKLDQKIRTFVEKGFDEIGGSEKIVISSCFNEENKVWEGKSLAECSEISAKDPYIFMKELLIHERLKVSIVGFGMSEKNLQKILKTPFVSICTDSAAYAPYGKLNIGKPHPRMYGSFPRVLGKYVRQEKIISLEEAIRKMTSLPAEKIRLKKRGVLNKGYYADIVVFNPDTVIDEATFTTPHKFPLGIDYVLVNGKLTINKGKHTGVTEGKILKHG